MLKLRMCTLHSRNFPIYFRLQSKTRERSYMLKTMREDTRRLKTEMKSALNSGMSSSEIGSTMFSKEMVLHASVCNATYLQCFLEQLVHLRHLGGNAEVDGAVADLDDETAADVWVDLNTCVNTSSNALHG